MAQSEDQEHGKGNDHDENPDGISMPGGQRAEGQAKGHDKHDHDEHPGQGKGHDKHDNEVNPDAIGLPGGS